MPERMTFYAEDWIHCLCGNENHLDGFSLTKLDGSKVDPDDDPTFTNLFWDGDTLTCNQCGRIFSLETGVVSGRASQTPQDGSESDK